MKKIITLILVSLISTSSFVTSFKALYPVPDVNVKSIHENYYVSCVFEYDITFVESITFHNTEDDLVGGILIKCYAPE